MRNKMSDEIQIMSIELENYRQYFGRHKIEFLDRDKGFTIIFGKNGDGKSNLLNAITWCLYHSEPHGVGDDRKILSNKRLPVINTRYITELGEEQVGKARVKIWLKKGDVTYSISRVLEVLKHKLEFRELENGKRSMLVTDFADDRVPKGCEIINPNKSFVIEKKDANEPDFHDTMDESKPNTLIEKILPSGLSQYFILDGEFLEHFWRDSSTIKKGIEQISQLHLLSSLEKHMHPMTIPPAIGSSDVSKLAIEIQKLDWENESKDEYGNDKFSEERRWSNNENDDHRYYHASGQPRIDDLNEDIEKMKSRINEIFDEMPKTRDIDTLLHDRKSLENRMAKMKKDMDDLENKYIYVLITKSPYVFLKNHISKCVKTIEERMSLGDLPIRQRRQFADDLLNKGSCICGEHLDTENANSIKRRENIELFKKHLRGKDDLDAVVDMKYAFRHDFIDKYDVFLRDNFNNPRQELSKMETYYEELYAKHEEILAKLGNTDNDELTQLAEERKNLSERINSKEKLVKTETTKIALNKKELHDKKTTFARKSKQDQKYKKIAHRQKIWEDVSKQISQIYDSLKDEIRVDVQNKTWARFRKLIAHPENFKSFHIESDYSVHLLDTHNTNQIRDLSAGQMLILTLAFTTTLRDTTGYKFPLIIDSPLGKIDTPNKYNIATRIPEYLPNEQLILLVTDSEYVANLTPDDEDPNISTKPFGILLQKTVLLKHFKINKERSPSDLNVGNSHIQHAELIFDDDKKTWEVKNV